MRKSKIRFELIRSSHAFNQMHRIILEWMSIHPTHSMNITQIAPTPLIYHKRTSLVVLIYWFGPASPPKKYRTIVFIVKIWRMAVWRGGTHYSNERPQNNTLIANLVFRSHLSLHLLLYFSLGLFSISISIELSLLFCFCRLWLYTHCMRMYKYK